MHQIVCRLLLNYNPDRTYLVGENRIFQILQVRQLFGRRSEKRLPDYSQAQLTLFDAEQGTPAMEQEASVLTTLIEDIKQKAEERRVAKNNVR